MLRAWIIRTLIPINICNLIRFNKLNFIIHSIYNLTLLSFTLLFGNILLELFVFKSASVNFYILLNLFLSGKFFINSFSRADGSTDGRTYVSNRPNYWMKIKKNIYKNPASCHTVLSFVFLFFARGIDHIVVAGVLLCAPRTILIG